MSLHFIQEPLDKTPPGVVPTQAVTLHVNGQDHTIQIAPWTTLLDALREYMDLTGTKKGCDHGQCGACTVLVDGKRINSCLALATVYEGSEIQTIEGLGTEENLHPLQQAFIDHDAFQCGYCTPGQICSAVALINEGRAKTEDEVRELMSGNLCRCGAYTNILSAVMDVLHNGQVPVNNGTLVTIPAQPTKSSSVS
jgi:xanthine dehydrogenase YagT iron-sulfur-binding subunit